ncbi:MULTISPECIES: cyclophilin-like fold protein [unclassified Xanthomonas]|uniref:cyclophilin-like fold protein n=1 Tax=Xanthomonas sp. LMG 9002 TaxID=1591158 RepID=UPI001EEF0037|nr:cyclophilin-like fold protein [Xanthomonas sp. LMG 9002]
MTPRLDTGRAMRVSLPSARRGGRRPWQRFLRWLVLLAGLPIAAAGAADLHAAVAPRAAAAPSIVPEYARMWMTVGDRRFLITLADNAAARAFAAQLPLALDMDELNGNEKHAELPQPLPAAPHRPGTIRPGDLMLYRTQTLVVFYARFASAYSYTRLGWVDDPAGLAQALGGRRVRVAFSRD